jgi:MFS family permease
MSADNTSSTTTRKWGSLGSRNFQLFIFGQGISLIGTWMTRLATTWLVYHLTHSALLLGIVSFFGQIVSFILGPLAGVWVEKLDRKKVLLWCQVASGIQSLLLAFFAFSHRDSILEIILLTAFQGLINAFDLPARQSFLIRMVDNKQDLAHAIAINSSMTNGARLIGPTLAGLLIGAFGEAWCFFWDGLSYIAVIASLLMMKINFTEAKREPASSFQLMKEGWNYVRGNRPIRTILLLFSLNNLMGYPFMVLLPIFASRVLHGDAMMLGWLTACSSVGALIAALWLTMRRSSDEPIALLGLSSTLLGIGLIGLGCSHIVWLSFFFAVLCGFGLMGGASISNTALQLLVPEDKRARVMSYYGTAFFGSAPFGSLLAGVVAHQVGAPITVVITGVFCLFGSIGFAKIWPRLKKDIQKGTEPLCDVHFLTQQNTISQKEAL